MFNQEQIDLIRKMVIEVVNRQPRQRLHQSDIPPQTIKASHLENMVIKRGLAADLPSDGGAVGVLAYFGTDDDTLSIWNGSAWVDTTLT